MSEALKIKPHHLLDIIRDFGSGREHQPHPYGHDVHRLAGIIRENPQTEFEFTAEADSICAPCKNLINTHCIDKTEITGKETTKESWNRLLDGRIFKRLEIQEGTIMTAIEFCRLAQKKLGNLYSLYAEVEKSQTAVREKNLMQGLKDYLRSGN